MSTRHDIIREEGALVEKCLAKVCRLPVKIYLLFVCLIFKLLDCKSWYLTLCFLLSAYSLCSRLASNSEITCLCPLRAGIKGACHHSWLEVFFY